jgi:O-acetyl-ADP-ribose deacetylase (regulator of RNase III)
MESNITNQQYFNDDLPPAAPHFDEEATLLSARPVVPLEEIKDKKRSMKRVVFGLALAGSLVLGAVGAALIYKPRGQEPTTIVSAAIPGAAGIAVDEPTPAIAESVGGAVTGTLPEARAATVARKSVPGVSAGSAANVVAKPKRILSEQVAERGLSRAERINARRLRRRSEREAWRESGGHHRRSADDLLRIREIFEGPSRP